MGDEMVKSVFNNDIVRRKAVSNTIFEWIATGEWKEDNSTEILTRRMREIPSVPDLEITKPLIKNILSMILADIDTTIKETENNSEKQADFVAKNGTLIVEGLKEAKSIVQDYYWRVRDYGEDY